MYFSDPGKITGIEKSSKSYEHGSDRIEPPGIESSFDSFVCGHSSRRNKRRDNRIRFSTSLSHVESATIEADILFDIFLPCGKIILQIRNSVSPQISYPQIEYSLNSREVYGLASTRPVKKVAMRVVADEKDHRKLHLTLNVIQCMKVISGTNRKTDLRQNIQPKTESRSMKISPESHKYKPRPNKNKSTTIIGLYILQ